MKIAGSVGMRMAAIVAVAAASACAEERVSEGERVVSVCIQPGNEVQATYRAKALASRIFAGIGVRVVWHS